MTRAIRSSTFPNMRPGRSDWERSFHPNFQLNPSKWLSNHRASIGRRSTVDLKERFLTPERAGDPGADADSERASVKAKSAMGSDIPD